MSWWHRDVEPAKDADEDERRRTELSVASAPSYAYVPIRHVFICRLDEEAAFNVTSPDSLMGVGFASFAVGILTIFRITPMLLFNLAYRLNTQNFVMGICRKVVYMGTWLWLGIVLFVLIILGIIPTVSERITNRNILMWHPWGLMTLYFDIIVWLSLTLTIHIGLISLNFGSDYTFENLHNHVAYFVVIYLESIIFGFGYYCFATYFIAAELTVIERFY